MRGIVAREPGGPDVLQLADLPDPVPGPGELLIDVVAAGVNRAALLPREGHYPVPPRCAAWSARGGCRRRAPT